MSENTKFWDILGRTDPAHVKRFKRAGGFEGTAIKPMWSFRRMTEEFGPCGKGWGVDRPEFQVVPAGDGEVLVYCTAMVWWREGGNDHQVFGVGGDKVAGKNKYGLQTDDEAFKKAFTDAVTNALKLIGVGADVHMGMFDDNKYVNTMKEEFAEAADPPKRQVGINPQTGMATAHALKKDKGPDNWDAFQSELLECNSGPMLTKLALGWSTIAERDLWPTSWRELAKEEINKRRELLKNSAPDDDVFPGDLPSNYVSTLQAG